MKTKLTNNEDKMKTKKQINPFSSEGRRLESFKKTMEAKKRRKEYEKSPEGLEEKRQRIEKLKIRHNELAKRKAEDDAEILKDVSIPTMSLEDAINVGLKLKEERENV